MAKETLVGEFLTDEMIKAGEKLLQSLKEADFVIVAAFWLYFPEADEWRLTLVSPRLDREGPRKLYNEIAEVLYKENHNASGVSLRNITLLSPNDNLVKAVAGTNQLIPLAGKRFTGNRMNGVLIDDIYVYFINESVTPPPGPRWMSK